MNVMRIYPEEFEFDKYSLRDLGARERFCRTYTWAIPSQKAIQSIVKFSEGERIIEIGAGKGYWAKLINSFGGARKSMERFCSRWKMAFQMLRTKSKSNLPKVSILSFAWISKSSGISSGI